MRFILLILGLVLVAAAAQSPVFPSSPPTFEASEFTTWDHLRHVGKSRRAEIDISFKAADGTDDQVKMTRVDLVGNAKERGFAHGSLLAAEILDFVGPKLNKYYADQVLNLDISKFPEPLQKILQVAKIVGAKAAPSIFKAAFQWVWDREAKYVPQSILDEMDGIAEGLCDTVSKTGKSCDVEKWKDTIRQVNMLPELIRMACTAWGAWGKSTPNGGLIQARALDFGPGPFAQFNTIMVHRDPQKPGRAFVAVTWPGFVGIVTGVSQNGIGISEKVWMVYTGTGLQPGHYDGLADVLTLRHILEESQTKADAEAYIQSIPRTWGMWVGIGDFKTQQFDLVGYREADAEVFTDKTMPLQTGQPYLESVCYVDKHPQPSGDGPTGTLPVALSSFYGNITLSTGKTILQYHQTGDVHTAMYDFTGNQMFVSIGKTDKDGNYVNGDEGCAFNRPSLRFSLKDLWEGK